MGSVIVEVGSHRQRLRHLLATTGGTVRIASAYVTESDLLDDAENREIRLLTAITPMDIVSGATSLKALKALMDKGIDCRFVPHDPRLHAKVYIFGDESALVTSANLTGRALDSNTEVGAFVDKREIRALASWFDGQWNSATRLDARAVDQWNQRIAALPIDYSIFRAKCRRLPPAGAPSDYRRLSAASVPCFLCNSNRPSKGHFDWGDRHIEELMKKRGFAAAWESFDHPSHMQRVQRGDIILLFANGPVGIIAIGEAKGKCETLPNADPRRLFSGFETPEWRVPVDWLAWVEDNNAYRWDGSVRPSFLDINKNIYKSKREAALQLLLGDR